MSAVVEEAGVTREYGDIAVEEAGTPEFGKTEEAGTREFGRTVGEEAGRHELGNTAVEEAGTLEFGKTEEAGTREFGKTGAAAGSGVPMIGATRKRGKPNKAARRRNRLCTTSQLDIAAIIAAVEAESVADMIEAVWPSFGAKSNQ